MIRLFYDKYDLFYFSPIKLVLISVSFSVFTLIQQEELMGWHPSVVKRTGIVKCAISVNQLQKHM